ncbi:MAG: MFS transporter [Gammaproteobacteria bacterium]|jgi:MFS family permease|nr:MFS transporter [Gammaproteobacteria bacterium]MDP6616455.1 MFS transporter [Gammaproteobacteria bacterium]MDP6696086.1 MFS transporter [Gammaproteobacteria bacterium]
MNSTNTFGPIRLAPGVTVRHVLCYLFAAGISIGMFTYLMTLTPYILIENLGIPEAEHGRIIGNLQFLQEIVVLSCIGWWGAMSDRFGRRYIYIVGWLIMMTGYGIYSFATSLPELFIYRMVFALAVAATTTNLSAILADYPQEVSRGKFTGMAFVLNGAGAVAFFVGMTQLPGIFQDQGADPIWAGRYAYLCVAGLAFIAAVIMTGLKPGLPEGVEPKKPVLQLIKEGIKAGRNKRIAIAYLGAFAARADMAIITLFVILWVIQASGAAGLDTAAAQARGGMFVGVCSMSAVIWAPIFGFLSDKLDRLTITTLAFALATIGYGWLGTLDDILSLQLAIPALILVGIGQSSTALACIVLLGQESPSDLRGSVFGLQSFCGALGILAISSGGGYLFDLVGPGMPFIAVAIANGVVFAVGIIYRRQELKEAIIQPAS